MPLSNPATQGSTGLLLVDLGLFVFHKYPGVPKTMFFRSGLKKLCFLEFSEFSFFEIFHFFANVWFFLYIDFLCSVLYNRDVAIVRLVVYRKQIELNKKILGIFREPQTNHATISIT